LLDFDNSAVNGLGVQIKVKICGITSREDAMGALDAGADALGFVFYSRSPRYIAPKAAAEIIASLPPFISNVGLFVNASAQEVRQIIERTGIDTLQFHGDEPAEYCAPFLRQCIKAFRVANADSLRQLPEFQTRAWLLDSFVPGEHGGTGVKFNWALANRAVSLNRPVILAGGLTSENVQEAIRQVRPYAVDVSSGVESSPGKKDLQKVRSFIQLAKSA
jgi:phosphoribosylanthranilate isomerase